MSAQTHNVEMHRGYLKLACRFKYSDGTEKRTEGGWVDDQTGHLYAGVCECGNQAIGWSPNEVMRRIHDAEYQKEAGND